MELGTGAGIGQVRRGLEEERESEGVGGEGVAAELLHLFVEMDGFLGEAAQGVVAYEGVPHSETSLVRVVAVETCRKENGVHLERRSSLGLVLEEGREELVVVDIDR